MHSLVSSLAAHDRLLKTQNDDRDQSVQAALEFESSVDSVFTAARYHLEGTHITTTYPDGSSGRKEVSWHPNEQFFTDWGNNYWLHGPESFLGERNGGKWVLRARDDREVIVKAILDRAALHSKHNQLVQRMWSFYWQLLFMDATRHNDEATIDLHLQPLDVSTLAPKPGQRYNLDGGPNRKRVVHV